MKTKFLLGAIVVAVLAVFGVLAPQTKDSEAAALVPLGYDPVAPAASLNSTPGILGVDIVSQQATTCAQVGVATTITCDMSATSNSASQPPAILTFTVTDQFGRVLQHYVQTVPVTYGNTRSEPLRDGSSFGDQRTTGTNQFGLLPFSGTQLTQSVDGYTNFEGVISAVVYVDDILAPGTTLANSPNASMANPYYPLGDNLSLPNYLGVPNIVLTATSTVVGPPASNTVADAPASLCGEKATMGCTQDSAGQNISDRIRAAFNGASSVAGGTVRQVPAGSAASVTIVIDSTTGIAYLLTSTDHVGPYEVVVTDAGGLRSTLTPPNVLALRDVTRSTFGSGPAAPGSLIDNITPNISAYFPWYKQGLPTYSPSSDPVNAQATVTGTVPVVSAAASHPDVTAPRTGQGPADAFAIPPAPVADVSAGRQVDSPIAFPVNVSATACSTSGAVIGITCTLVGMTDSGEVPVNAIRPPNTGDAGLATSSGSSWTLVAGALMVIAIASAAVATVTRR